MRHSQTQALRFSSLRLIASRVLLVTLGLFLMSSNATLAASPGSGTQVGTNLGYLNDLAGDWPFVDVFKTSSRWYLSGPNCWDCPGLDVDDEGWLRTIPAGHYAHTFVFSQVPNAMPHDSSSQYYHVYYDGVGELDYDGSAQLVSHQTGYDVVEVDPTSAESFAITIVRTASTGLPGDTTPASEYIRNIRVIAPGGVCSNDPFQACMTAIDCPTGGAPTCDLFTDNDNYLTQIFHPRFLANVEPFDVVRLMDWSQTIEGDTTDYTDYPTEQSARWHQAPATIMAELANRLDADIWINIPHYGDSNFARAFADDLAPALEIGRKVYVEFANEVWNWDFPVYAATTADGCNAYPALDCTTEAGSDTARARQTVDRSIDIWGDFVAAFNAVASGTGNDRVVRVLASQIGNHDLHGELLTHRNVYQTVDAFAVGGYFGWFIGGDDIVQSWGYEPASALDPLFARLQQEVDDTLGDLEWDYLYLANNPNYASIPLVLYEGGQGLVAWGENQEGPLDPNDGITSAWEHSAKVFAAANRDPRMGDMYDRLLAGWQTRAGGVLFNHYVNTRAHRPWQHYGALEHQRFLDDPNNSAPKYEALIDFINSLP